MNDQATAQGAGENLRGWRNRLMGLVRRRPWRSWQRAELEAMPDAALVELLKQVEARWERLERARARETLYRSMVRKRSGRLVQDSLTPVRLTGRLERLFTALREGARDPWPVEEALHVMDGLVARMVAKRLTLLLVGLLTIVPAVGTLVLLAQQNQHLIEQSQVEGAYQLEAIRKGLMEVINGTSRQWVQGNGDGQWADLPSNHKRIREEAMASLVAVEKRRWTLREREATPPTRYVDLRGANLAGLALGGALGLVTGEARDDFSRLYLAGADVRGTRFLRSKLTGTVFHGAQAEGLQLSSADATYCDFSDMVAPGSRFLWDSYRSEPLDLSHARFDGADLTGAVFDQAVVSHVNFDGARLSGVQFYGGIWMDVDLTGAELGQGMDFADSMVHRTRVRADQRMSVALPPFCDIESTDDPGVLLIVTDAARYEAWWQEQQAAMEAAVEQELEANRTRQQELDAAN
jgi:uncharacterized protein YjbI with pentapeptide repeats